MGEYNKKKSISVNKLTKEELDIAIKDWAEGDLALEHLLKTCYQNDIETIGCHAGKISYLEFFINNSHKKITSLLNQAELISNSEILLSPDGGNPTSGDDWYKPSISISFFNVTKEEVDNYFNLLSDSITKDIRAKFYSSILKLHDFFANKETSLIFRMGNRNNKYYLKIELVFRQNKYDYFNSLFTKANLEYYQIVKGVHAWKLEEDNIDIFTEKLAKTINYIVDNCSLELPNYDELESFSSKALYKKREFGDSKEGKQKLELWIDKNKLLLNIYKIHTTKLGEQRISKNLNITNVVDYIKNIIQDNNCIIYKKGKNYYCHIDNIIITINSYNYCIITAHKEN